MKRLFLLLPVLTIIIASSCPDASETKGIIAHKIINKSESEAGILSIDVQVNLINGRIPNKNEIDELSEYLAGQEKEHESIKILFYLPDRESESDIYASANYKHEQKAKIVRFIFLQHLLSK